MKTHASIVSEQLKELIGHDEKHKEVWQHILNLEQEPENESSIEGIHRKILRQVSETQTHDFLYTEWQKEHEDNMKYASTFELGEFLCQS